jgi:hypothetical protein
MGRAWPCALKLTRLPPATTRRRLAEAGEGHVFVTDALLTTLMCVRSSKYAWDLVFTKRGGQVRVR